MASTSVMISAMLICICFCSNVNSFDFLPTAYYRRFRGFIGKEKLNNGTASVTIDGIITNISTHKDWEGDDTITILDGGIGQNHVTFQYLVPEGVTGNFESRIYTSEDLEDTVLQQSEFTREKTPRSNIALEFHADGQYRSANVSRTERFAFRFNDVIQKCSGDSRWSPGGGNRTVDGGINENYLDVTLELPEGTLSKHGYLCHYVHVFDPTYSWETNAVSMFRNTEAEEGTMLCMTYIDLNSGVIGFSVGVSGVILSYETEMEWLVGTGEVTVVGGGVNYGRVEYKVVVDGHSYGTQRGTYFCTIEV